MKTLKLTFALFLLLVGNLLTVSLATAALAAEPLYFSFEQRLMISYALLAQGEAPGGKQLIVKRLAAQGLKAAEAGTKEIQVKNFDEFLKAYRGEWPDTNSLALDLQMIEARETRGVPRFTSPSAGVQRKIDKFIESQNNQLLAIATERFKDVPGLKSELSAKVISSFSEQLKDLNSPWTQKIMLTATSLSEELIGAQIHELEHLGEKVSQSKLVSQKDPVARIVLETLLNGYFAGLGLESKKLLLSSFLGADLRSTDLEKFELLVQNSGPQLQKLLQVVSRQGDLDPEMAKIFRKLESSVRPVPWSQVQKILDREKGNFEFVYFERKPLGVGSMAQVHRAKIILNGQRKDVVVRFIKPNITERVQEDDRILKSIAETLDANPILRKMNFPKIASMVEDITRTVTAELDQQATIERQILGKTAYDQEMTISTKSGYKNSLKFQVPSIIPGRAQSALMVQELVIGSKLDKEYLKFEDEIPELKKAVIEKLATLWLKEALFGSGFYHADLHQGNFMLRVEEPAPVLTILDYGMTGVLSKEMQSEVIALGAGFRGLDADMISRGLWKISDQEKNTIGFFDFEKEIQGRVQKVLKHEIPVPSTDEWIVWAINKGLHPSYEFISLNRGNAIIASMLHEVGSEQTIEKITEKLSMEHPALIARALLSHRSWSFRSLLRMAMTPAKPPQAAAAVRCESVFLN